MTVEYTEADSTTMRMDGDASVARYHKLNIEFRGVAQLVARLVRDQEAAGSNPVTSTKKHGQPSRLTVLFLIDGGI